MLKSIAITLSVHLKKFNKKLNSHVYGGGLKARSLPGEVIMSRLERTQKWVSVLLVFALVFSFVQPISFAFGEEAATGPEIQSTAPPIVLEESPAGDLPSPSAPDAPRAERPSEVLGEPTPATLDDVSDGSSLMPSPPEDLQSSDPLEAPALSREIMSLVSQGDDNNQDDGRKITITKTLLNHDGSPYTGEPMKFRVEVDGPGNHNDGTYDLWSNHLLVLDDLHDGNYFIEELRGEGFTGPGDAIKVVVNRSKPHERITITNRLHEEPTGILTGRVVVKNWEGNVIGEPREFSVKVTGPEYPPEGEIRTIASGTPAMYTNLELGTYMAVLNGDYDDYDVSYTQASELTEDSREGEFVICLTEKALGALTINKVFIDNAGTTIEEDRPWSVTLTGPSYPSGHDFNIEAGSSLVVPNLIYGNYSATELNADDYMVAISGTAMLCIGDKTDTITITNSEKNLGELTVRSVYKDASGNILDVDKDLDIVIHGPSYVDPPATGMGTSLNSMTPFVGTNLKYGHYWVSVAYDVTLYTFNTVTISDPQDLSIDDKSGEIVITVQMKPSDVKGEPGSTTPTPTATPTPTPVKSVGTKTLTSTTVTPKTGDANYALMWTALLLLGLASMGASIQIAKKKTRESNN